MPKSVCLPQNHALNLTACCLLGLLYEKYKIQSALYHQYSILFEMC